MIQRALQEMGAEAVPALLVALENKDPAVRAGLREALRWMQDDAVARLADALPTARPALQREILQVLEQKSFRLPRKPEDLARYRAMLRSPDSEVREAAASLLGALGGADPAAVQGLVSALAGDSTLTVRVAAARALERMASALDFKALPLHRGDVATALAAAAHDADASLRAAAVGALAGWVTDTQTASQVARITLADGEEQVQLAAVQLLAHLDLPTVESAPWLRPLLEKGSPQLKVASLRVIEALGVNDEATVLGVIPRLRDPDAEVRATAARTLGKILAKRWRGGRPGVHRRAGRMRGHTAWRIATGLRAMRWR